MSGLKKYSFLDRKHLVKFAVQYLVLFCFFFFLVCLHVASRATDFPQCFSASFKYNKK